MVLPDKLRDLGDRGAAQDDQTETEVEVAIRPLDPLEGGVGNVAGHDHVDLPAPQHLRQVLVGPLDVQRPCRGEPQLGRELAGQLVLEAVVAGLRVLKVHRRGVLLVADAHRTRGCGPPAGRRDAATSPWPAGDDGAAEPPASRVAVFDASVARFAAEPSSPATGLPGQSLRANPTQPAMNAKITSLPRRVRRFSSAMLLLLLRSLANPVVSLAVHDNSTRGARQSPSSPLQCRHDDCIGTR